MPQLIEDTIMRPLLTIIIPHKDTPTLLRRCIASIPNRQDIQTIVVDDHTEDVKAVRDLQDIFSDFCCIFAMSLMILLVLICSTKVSEKSDMAKS